jgi:ATP-dependent Clp protease ATP-binding subunit ClpA
MLFEGGIFAPYAMDDERVFSILSAAVDRGAPVRPADLLHAAIMAGDPGIRAAISHALPADAKADDVLEVIDAYNPPRRESAFDGRAGSFSAEALTALEAFEAAITRNRSNTLESLVLCVLRHLDAEDARMLHVLDVPAAIAALDARTSPAAESAPLFEKVSGRLRSEEFTVVAWQVMERSRVLAVELGHARILPPHCFLALLGETNGIAERLIRLQLAPDVSLARLTDAVAVAFRFAGRAEEEPRLDRQCVSETLTARLADARQVAALWGSERIDTPHLMAALLDGMPGPLASLLEADPFRLDVARMHDHLEQALRQARSQPVWDEPFRLPAELVPSQDLSWLARRGEIQVARHLDAYFEPIARALHRRTRNHVLITGQRGVGTTTLVRELARRAAAGEIGFLAAKRFLLADCRDVVPEDSLDKLRAIIARVSGRTDVVLCLDGLGPLLRGRSSANNKVALRAALREQAVHLVAIADSNDHEDLIAGDAAFLEHFSVIEMAEPAAEQSLDMARAIADSLAEEFGFAIEPAAVERAVSLAVDYVLSEHHPRKAARILRRACEDLDYARAEQASTRKSVSPADVIRVIAEISGLPEAQLAGVGQANATYDEDLRAEVVGQDEAVAAVAQELRLIKAGLVPRGKPASVLLFAGLTGVGKTELAKTLARFYSASKMLRTYTMGNFTERHSVAGITGSPPGYVAYEEGGRVVNDLNADPYCVFLLDEAEKAHPEVWRPFLTLFDEGWVVDQRGVRAFGDRAIFVLTSNAGSETISRMTAAGRPADEIVAAVQAELRDLRHPQSKELVFPPEFLARIQRVIVFKPLDYAAMEGICRKLVARRKADWSRQRGKELAVPERLIGHVAEASHQQNKQSGDREGGRLVEKMLARLIDDRLAVEISRQPDAYRACQRVELSWAQSGVGVTFTEASVAAPGKAAR